MRIETDRLVLRSFKTFDQVPFAALNGDPDVMRYFPKVLTREESDAVIRRISAAESENGFCFMAAEDRTTGEFVGLIGIARIGAPLIDVLPGRPPVEIGWRLGRRFWGQGLATEGARACLEHGWRQLGLDEIVAFTFRGNLPSRRVMERLGMSYSPLDDFGHTNLAENHPLRPHVLYRIRRPT